MLDIKVKLPYDNPYEDTYETFRSDLNSSLGANKYGSCGSNDILRTGSSGYFEFPVYLSNLHDGLNHLKEKCLEMKPTPKVEVSILGEDKHPIDIFPVNGFSEYLEGLEEGEKFKNEVEKILDEAIESKKNPS